MAVPELRDNLEETRFEVWIGEERAAVAEYELTADTVVFVHTEVSEAFSGRGLGGALARAALDDVRARGLRVLPLCPFFKGWIDRHPPYQDLLVEA